MDAAGHQPVEPTLRKDNDTVDQLSKKFVEKTGKLQEKALKKTDKDSDSKTPAGGYDSTPIPSAPPGYTLRITFHRAENLPFADINTLSSDPYIHATLKTSLEKRHKQDNDLVLRTPTIHRNVNPKWETQWVVAHVPASGFQMKCRLYDEDPADHDDRLGNVHVNVDHVDDKWQGFHEKPFEIKKRMGSKRAYTFRGAAALFSKDIKMSGNLVVSVENLGKSPGDSGGRAYTVAPLPWSRHHSPLIGRIAGTKDREEDKDGKKGVDRYNFQAIQMQLRGPVPAELYHRYVEFKPFVAGMFTDVSLRGKVLNRALHHQHARIYNFDSTTVYGIFEKPCLEMTKQLLEFVHYDEGGRIFTYVITLDGQWRFTETGKEFGIDLLSKHTMHSDVSIYIAFSGEFFVRRLKHPHQPHRASTTRDQDLLPPGVDKEEPERPRPADEQQPHHTHPNTIKDPSHYELIIDNDSGTYRPNHDLLPVLRDYMSQNFPQLHIVTLDSQKDAEKMGKLKNEQRERKNDSGNAMMYMQNSSVSSFSSSDEEKLNARAQARSKQAGDKKKASKLKGPHKSAREGSSASSSDDVPEDAGHQDEAAQQRQALGEHSYTNNELPDLVKRPKPEETRAEGEGEEQGQGQGQGKGKGEGEGEGEGQGEGQGEGEPDKGENKPAGGIAYHRVVPTAAS